MVVQRDPRVVEGDDGEHGGPRLVWVFAAEAAQVAAVRAAVGEALPGECGRRDDVEVVAGELASNAARHSRGDEFAVQLSLSSSLVELTVHDEGGDTTPTLQEPPDPLAVLDAGPEAFEHGRGLRLVEGYSDSWGHSADESGCVTWARFHLPTGGCSPGRADETRHMLEATRTRH